MTHLSIKNLSVCLIYGVMSICQTLNSRYLYRNLNFNFYSFVFGMQRIAIMIVFYLYFKNNIKKQMILRIVPYSFVMCLSNLLSSYCLTIMPLAAFLSFKKFIVLFILILAVSFNLPAKTTKFQNICMIGIITGGAMVGEKDLLHGNFIGYICCLTFNLSQSIGLHYSQHLYNDHKIQPSQLLLYNCIVSLPYYLGVIAYQAEFDDIYFFFRDNSSFTLIIVLLFSIVLSCVSQLSSSYIAMKISPFQKSTVANIKDLILMLISVQYFHDLSITMISGLGILLCLLSSALFTLPFLQQKEHLQLVSNTTSINFHLQQGTSLFDDKIGSRSQSSRIFSEEHQNTMNVIK